MRSARVFVIVLILGLSSLACFGSGTQVPPSDILFSDDFSTKDNKWDQITETDRSTDYFNNAYRILVSNSERHVWANPQNREFSDARIEVDATKNGGPDDNDFGIICRYGDVNAFYYGVVSSDGFYGIYKVTDNGGEPIGNDTMLESDQINQGTATNHVRFDCIGSSLSLYVNGELVDEQTDSTYTTGNVGLMAGTYTTGGTDILFDNFFVYNP